MTKNIELKTGVVAAKDVLAKSKSEVGLRPAGSVTPESVAVEVLAQQEIEFKEICSTIVSATIAVGEKYLTLCEFIRDNNVGKRQATTWLKDMGFAKNRASEVCRIAYAKPEDWTQFKARSLGWRGMLQLTRGNLEEMRQVAPAVVSDEVAREVESEIVRDEESAQASAGAVRTDEQKRQDKLAAYRAGLEKSALALLKRANLLDVSKPMKWAFEGYTLALTRKVKPGPKPASGTAAPSA